MIVVAITGASGVVYGVRLLEALKEAGKKTALLVTEPARIIIDYELEISASELESLAYRVYDSKDLTAAINSGSCRFESMVIVPATMKTVAAISQGYASNAVTRTADVALKEHRKLVMVPRETPLRQVHLENMLKLSREGVIILPAMPAFYHQPEDMGDLVDFVVGKILDVLCIDHHLYQRWREGEP
ncbi:MAG TPA: UbiX family flavin prenyltransferase [Methanobacteriaceae archaeon]|jgi:4-hydroxy-3-polyprenylbenzoate decarboxylase|nr:UbiX family flavin prenyltransferase [Euryarchaeota archaeon]HNR25889.1 UbiX family flavin prenyltransferase [Methanobacteriaceae archaeon]